jgi:hypothetical protein
MRIAGLKRRVKASGPPRPPHADPPAVMPNNGFTLRLDKTGRGTQMDRISVIGSVSVLLAMQTGLVAGAASPALAAEAAGVVPAVTITKTTIVSTSSSGVYGNGSSVGPGISANGRFVVFSSSANNLVSGDTNKFADIFEKNLSTGTLTRVSLTSSGLQGNNSSAAPWIWWDDWGTAVLRSSPVVSNDGRYVAFSSLASNFASSDVNQALDVFVKDTLSGQIKVASATSGNIEGNAASTLGGMTPDGRYVVINSIATNLVKGVNGYQQVYVKDMKTKAISLASTSASGNVSDGDCGSSSISNNGRYVAFICNAKNLVTGLSNGDGRYYIKDMLKGSVIGNDAYYADTVMISGDGKSVVYSDNENGRIGIYDLTKSTQTVLVANRYGDLIPRISANGAFTVFDQHNGTDAHGNNTYDTYVVNNATGVITPALSSHKDTTVSAISANGQFIAISTPATLVAGDKNNEYDVYVTPNPLFK